MTMLGQIVIHQNGFFSSIIDETGLKEANLQMSYYADDYLQRFGNKFRSFKHGALFGLFAILPVLGINALFERKSFKYIIIKVGLSTVSAALMGGVIC